METAATVRADDGAAYVMALPGASGELVRITGSDRPTELVLRRFGSVATAEVEMGFTVAGEARADDDTLVVVSVLDTPPGGKWDGIDLRGGSTFVYGPGATQAALDPAGLRYVLTAVPWESIERAAETLGRRPPSRTLRSIVPATRPGWVSEFVTQQRGSEPAEQTEQWIVQAIVELVTRPSESDPKARGWSSQEIVRECVAFLERNGTWRAPVLTLCRHVGVSERRLQTAFTDVTGVGVAAFLRQRALQAARQVLIEAPPDIETVTDVAADHGFSHAGRFAAMYRRTYGEPPSASLARSNVC